MIDATFRKIILEMGPQSIKDLVGVMKSNQHVVAIDLVTTEDVLAMDAHYKKHYEALAGEKTDGTK